MQQTSGMNKVKQTNIMTEYKKAKNITDHGGIGIPRSGGRAGIPSLSGNRTGRPVSSQARLTEDTTGLDASDLRREVLMSTREMDSDASDWTPLMSRRKRGGKRNLPSSSEDSTIISTNSTVHVPQTDQDEQELNEK